MRWGDPKFFLLLFLVPVWAVAAFFWARSRKRALKQLCDERFAGKLIPLQSRLRRLVKQALWGVSLVLLIVTAAEPKWGYHFEEVVRKGVDLMLVVDVSNSMLAEDVKPSRLERAKRKIYDLLKMAQGDRIGMIVFAGRPVLLSPLTLDYQAVHQFIESLSPDILTVQGSDLAAALKLAMKAFKDPKSEKAMMVFSDGEDFSENLSAVAKDLAQAKIPVYILGVGTPEGAPIPLPRGEGGFKRDDAGNVVVTKLKEKALADLAVSTGGEYVRSVTNDEDLNEIYAKGLKGALTGSEVKTSKKRVYESRFQWPLGVAILLLLAESLLGENRRVEKKREEEYADQAA